MLTFSGKTGVHLTGEMCWHEDQIKICFYPIKPNNVLRIPFAVSSRYIVDRRHYTFLILEAVLPYFIITRKLLIIFRSSITSNPTAAHPTLAHLAKRNACEIFQALFLGN